MTFLQGTLQQTNPHVKAQHTQGSRPQTFGAEKANDGDKRRNIDNGQGSCSHTLASGQTIAWWQVDLQDVYNVSGISITTRDGKMIVS